MALGDTLKPAEAVKLPKPATSAQIIKAISGDSSTISADYAADWVRTSQGAPFPSQRNEPSCGRVTAAACV